MRSGLLLLVGLIVASSPASAQDVRDLGTTTRGRIGRDATAAFAARDAAAQAGVSCTVTHGIVRGRGADGAAQYEVACAESPGFIVIGGPPYRAISCLALSADGRAARGPDTCRLRENRDLRPHYARMAAAAGLACVVDEGRLAGLSPRGASIYEIGCAGPSGYWLEPSGAGWLVTECLTVASQGGECRLTTRREDRAAFRSRLAGTPLDRCDVTDVRAMGQGGDGSYFEVRCGAAQNLVVNFDSAGVFREAIPCTEAASIGGGCLPSPVVDRRMSPEGPPRNSD